MQSLSSIEQYLANLCSFLKIPNGRLVGLVCRPIAKFGYKTLETVLRHCLQQKNWCPHSILLKDTMISFFPKMSILTCAKFGQKWLFVPGCPHKLTLVSDSTLIGLSNSAIKSAPLSPTILTSDLLFAHWTKKKLQILKLFNFYPKIWDPNLNIFVHISRGFQELTGKKIRMSKKPFLRYEWLFFRSYVMANFQQENFIDFWLWEARDATVAQNKV